MATGQRVDPYRGFNFKIEITGLTLAGFREASGLSFTTDVVEYREGSDVPLHPRKLHGLRKFSNITLKRGFTQSRDLWLWYADVLDGNPQRKNGAIVLEDEEHTAALRWEFENGWITRWDGPTLNATANDVVIESIEIAVERVMLKE